MYLDGTESPRFCELCNAPQKLHLLHTSNSVHESLCTVYIKQKVPVHQLITECEKGLQIYHEMTGHDSISQQ